MALRRFRVARYADRYAVLDHGLPQGTTRVTAGQRAGEHLPRYVAADADDHRTDTHVVMTTPARSGGPTAADKAAARAEANQRNAEWEARDDSPHDEVLSDLDYPTAQEQE